MINSKNENKYISELKEKDYLLAFQKLVLDISFDFMTINHRNFDKKIDSLLKRLGNFLQADRSYLIKLEDNQLIYSHEWNNEDFFSMMMIDHENTAIDLRNFPYWQEQLNNNESIYYIEDLNQMSSEAKKEQAYLKKLNIQSMISVPLIVEKNLYGFIGIDSIRTRKKWTKENIRLLRALAKIIATGISQIKADQQINYMAYHDQLTGLPNTRLLTERIEEGIRQVSRGNGFLSIIFIDLDEFKKINDSLGHEQGDELLKQISNRLLNVVSEKDTVSRRGGDEFIIALRNYQNEEELHQIIKEIISEFEKPFVLENKEKFITASIGISRYPEDGDHPMLLMKNADIAMYHAKDLGKNQYKKMTKELKLKNQKSQTLTNDLYGAIDRGEMEVYYQPFVKGKTNEIKGLEALVRWKHPIYGYLPAEKFITIAEQSHLLESIGYWLNQKVAKQLLKWKQKGYQKVKMSVNYSIHELDQWNLKARLLKLINNYSLDPHYLEIEITESIGMDPASDTIDRLKEIEKLGITLTIDDYGKSYSSLSRLKDLPIGKIKIAPLFIQGIGQSKKDEMIIQGLISFAKSLELEIVAEGVETQAQVDFLNKHNCDLLQGYYIYQPMPAKEVEKLLTIEDY